MYSFHDYNFFPKFFILVKKTKFAHLKIFLERPCSLYFCTTRFGVSKLSW